MSKYYKLKDNSLKVKFIEGVDKHRNMFNGIVVDPTATLWQKSEFAECLSYEDFELYTPTPQELAEWGETPKYMKSIDPETKGLIIEYIADGKNDEFKGVVIKQGKSRWEVGNKSNTWIKSLFEPCELNTETPSNDNTNKVELSDKDINLRLECLKLAANSNKGIGHDASVIVAEAQEFYDWITKKD